MKFARLLGWTTCALALALTTASAARAADVDSKLPADTEQVVFINVRQIIDSELFKRNALDKVKDGLKKNAEATKYLEQLGVDPFKDITSMTIANVGTTGDKVMVVVKGKWDAAKVAKTLDNVSKDKPAEMKITKEGKITVYESVTPQQTVYTTIPDNSTLYLSTSKEFAVNGAKLDGKGGLGKELQAAVDTVDAKQSIWVATVATKEMKDALSKQGPTATIAPNLKAMTFALNVTDGAGVNLSIIAADKKSAGELADLLDKAKGILGAVGLTNDEAKPFVEEIMKTLAIKTKDSTVSVGFKLSADLIEKAIDKAKP